MSAERAGRLQEPKRRSIFRFVLTVAFSAVPFAILLWITWTHELHYNVYSDDVFWYQEDFPTYFNLMVTLLLSVLFGLLVAAIIRVARH